jgi:hypothetical protein
MAQSEEVHLALGCRTSSKRGSEDVRCFAIYRPSCRQDLSIISDHCAVSQLYGMGITSVDVEVQRPDPL